ncbi:MAG: 50S ribosomal protein L15 [Rickettsiales bacterium]|jgi:large subunit ribosomal protein L15|nr:50S ribosomal protein L15 [Rickettsiales bacterium]
MQLNELKANPGAKHRKMRVGRGIGSSKGKTAGRGGKGQTARTGVRINGFEGGQTPIHRRLPKRGFNNHTRVEYTGVNTGDLQKAIDSGKLDSKKEINLEVLKASGVVRKNAVNVKLLAKGELKAKLTIEIARASEAAKAAVEKAGGSLKVAASE